MLGDQGDQDAGQALDEADDEEITGEGVSSRLSERLSAEVEQTLKALAIESESSALSALSALVPDVQEKKMAKPRASSSSEDTEIFSSTEVVSQVL